MKTTPVRPGLSAEWTGLDGGNVTVAASAMPLTPAEKQRRYREKLKAADRTNADAIEQALMLEVERCERGELSDQERITLAEKLADLAMDLLWRSHSLSKMAHKLRTGEDHPLQR